MRLIEVLSSALIGVHLRFLGFGISLAVDRFLAYSIAFFVRLRVFVVSYL